MSLRHSADSSSSLVPSSQVGDTGSWLLPQLRSVQEPGTEPADQGCLCFSKQKPKKKNPNLSEIPKNHLLVMMTMDSRKISGTYDFENQILSC